MDEIVVIFGGAVIGFTIGAYIGSKRLPATITRNEFIPLFVISSVGMFVGAVGAKFYLDYNRRAF